jgi:hypothetical protein
VKIRKSDWQAGSLYFESPLIFKILLEKPYVPVFSDIIFNE